ncbi:WD40 repeat domain-containing protein [Nocardia crassostreae]|uniref:WD40 repeat domain-containing protein n=1 Tax=Nocardia crassostreae TaxID=53428 RepID=UPI000B0A43BE|nr:WD40 repeat domain-containing protein [Nocardia crassostreae]
MVTDLAFSPDGRTLAATLSDATRKINNDRAVVNLWDVTAPAAPRKLGASLDTGSLEANSLTFSPSGRVLAIAGSEGISLWNIAEPEFPTLVTNELSVSSSTCRDGRSEYPCAGLSHTAVFTSDDRTLLAAGGGGEIRTWSLPPSILNGHAGDVAAPLFDATGERLVTQSADGRITVWDLRDPLAPRRGGEFQLPPYHYGSALSPDGRYLMFIATHRTEVVGRILDLSDPARIRQFAEWSLPVSLGVRVSPDWRLLVGRAFDGSLRLWDFSDPSRPVPIDIEAKLGTTMAEQSFGSDSRTLFTQEWSYDTGREPTLIVSRWELTIPNRPRKVAELLRAPGIGVPGRAEFSPDHRTMAVIDGEMVQSWDISDPAEPIALGDPIAMNTRRIVTFRFAPDSRTVLTSDLDGAVQRWDFSDSAAPRPINGPLIEPDGSWSLAFHPSGRFAAGASVAGAIRLWDWDEQHAADRICAVTGNMWTEELWRRYLPQFPFDPPCN